MTAGLREGEPATHSRLGRRLATCPRRVISQYWSHEAPRRAPRGQHLEPGQGLLPEARAEEDRPRRVLPRRGAVRAQSRPAAADADAPPPRRRRGAVLLPETPPAEQPRPPT